jgi:hypothetical protein
MKIRKATESDYERILEIYAIAREFMIRSGNPDQWGRTNPPPKLVRADIENGDGYVIYDENGVRGVFSMVSGDDPTYGHIEGGAWLNSEPYVTIHRIASDGEAHGIFACAADYCKSVSNNVRVDTHEKNAPMIRQIEKNGFVKCGVIYVADGSPRIAYQWTDHIRR